MVVIRAAIFQASQGNASVTHICQTIISSIEGACRRRASTLSLARHTRPPSPLELALGTLRADLVLSFSALAHFGLADLIDHFQLGFGTLASICNGLQAKMGYPNQRGNNNGGNWGNGSYGGKNNWSNGGNDGKNKNFLELQASSQAAAQYSAAASRIQRVWRRLHYHKVYESLKDTRRAQQLSLGSSSSEYFTPSSGEISSGDHSSLAGLPSPSRWISWLIKNFLTPPERRRNSVVDIRMWRETQVFWAEEGAEAGGGYPLSCETIEYMMCDRPRNGLWPTFENPEEIPLGFVGLFRMHGKWYHES